LDTACLITRWCAATELLVAADDGANIKRLQVPPEA
jgi:hypothetical protein